MKTYYDRRAPEYDDWYEGRGPWDGVERPGWESELRALERALGALPPARTLDVACGTGYLTRWLPGEIVGLDQSERMLAIARERVPHGTFVRADATQLPFEDGAFERLFTGHFYGHLEDAERQAVLAEARRLARELVVVDASRAHADRDDEWQVRKLRDGSQWRVYKRYFSARSLLAELGGGDVLHEGVWFVATRTRLA